MFVNVQQFIIGEGASFTYPGAGFPYSSHPRLRGRRHRKQAPISLSNYTFHPHMDSEGSNITHKQMLANKHVALGKACDALPGCKGFNTEGWLKKNIKPMEEWSNWSADSNKGLYIRHGPGNNAEDKAMAGS